MLFSIVLLIFLIGINGIFSSSELAFLSLDKIQLKEEVKRGDKKAILIHRFLEEPSLFLSTIQIGITLAGFLASAFAADYFADYFLGVIRITFISESLFRTILVIIITVVLSYFTLIFGELVPKKIAINYPYKIARNFVGLIYVVSFLFYPLIKLLTFSTNFICKVLNIKEKEDSFTEEDIKKMILLGRSQGIIEEKEKEYILNIFNFNDIDVCQVMTPRERVEFINIDDSLKDTILKIKNAKFSRFPVYEEDIDHIIGVLNVKDLIIQKKSNKKIVLRDIIKPIHRFDKFEKIDDVFRCMQEINESMCAIYDKDKFIGIITIEDAVEEIVGNIYDEYD